MNVIKIKGGLGNQLFQYAFGRAQTENGIEVRYDVIKNARPYVLDKFHTEVKRNLFLKQQTLTDRFDLSYLKKDNCNFTGYWQYSRYTDTILPILRNEIRVKEKYYTPEFIKICKEIKDSNSVGIHVRRGDYATRSVPCILPIGYYLKALDIVNADKIYIFSDDIAWCKKNFKIGEFIHLADYLDFELMKYCKHQVISNSTFSRWAAYLNDNDNKIVVAPKCKGFGIEDQKGWIKI